MNRISSGIGASFRTASSSNGRFGSDIDLFFQEFDCKISFAGSSVADCIAEGQYTVKLGTLQRGFGRGLIDWSDRNAAHFSVRIRPDRARLAILPKT